MFEEMHLLNFSIRGGNLSNFFFYLFNHIKLTLLDLIQNILWRIVNGELELKPKVVVLHCGTNNTPVNSAEEISEGIIECVNQIRKKFDGIIVLLTLLPRGCKPNVLREKNEDVNKIIQEKCVGMQKVQIIDISGGLLQADKSISHHDMYDYLNLTNAASKKVFEPVWELLHQILSENEKEILLTPSE
jgi:platelet-activating factor acetylhydrolase IB subunit beta/gamma